MTGKLLLAATLAAFTFGSAQAATISVESGGITLNSTDTSTSGAAATPWLINEAMTAPGTLKFSGNPLGGDNPTGSGHSRGKWVSKTVTNNTGVVWTSFELELQTVLGTPSTEGDGLSFAQGFNAPFSSDKFAIHTHEELLRDYLNFSSGSVGIGESVTFNFIISDNSNNDPFWLLQTANVSDNPVPEPASLALVGLALGGLGLSRARRRT